MRLPVITTKNLNKLLELVKETHTRVLLPKLRQETDKDHHGAYNFMK